MWDKITRMITGSMIGPIDVVLADRHVTYRRALRRALEEQEEQRIFVLGEAGTFSELTDLLAETRPTVLMIDPRMPDALGLEAITHVSRTYPAISIIVLTKFSETPIMREAVLEGAHICLVKDIAIGRLVDAIQLAAKVSPPAYWSKQNFSYERFATGSLATRPLLITTRDLN